MRERRVEVRDTTGTRQGFFHGWTEDRFGRLVAVIEIDGEVLIFCPVDDGVAIRFIDGRR